MGSSRVGHKVYRMASMHGKRVQASMSAKNHAVVMPDADMDFAAHAIARASFGAAGQRSMAVAGDERGGVCQRHATCQLLNPRTSQS